MDVRIRPYDPADFDAVSRICLFTAAAGTDATGVFSSDELMPDLWARPYLELAPEWAWVVDDGRAVSGYLLATPDTRAFAARYRHDWLPRLAASYEHVEPPTTDDERMRHLGFSPDRMLIPELDDYPAHLHIDLLPGVQGRGLGRALIATLEDALRATGIAGVHLGLDPANVAARAFYEKLGFVDLPSSTADEPLLAKRIRPAADGAG